MSVEDGITLGLLALYLGTLVLDRFKPARRFARVRAWRLRGALFFMSNIVLASVAPFLWDAWLGDHGLLDASRLPLGWAVLIGLLAVELGIYLWHRTLHRVDFLWRWFHQLHHSAERIDVWGAFYSHPLDVLGFALVGSLALVWGLGLAPMAAVIVNAVVTFLTFFQHANLRTPRWLGYFIIRPEMHALHHQRDVHAFNYSDLPLWDMVFGTFRNPARWEGVGGFYDGASGRVWEMLLGRDVSRPAPATSTQRAGAEA